jgi:hypothetical protein
MCLQIPYQYSMIRLLPLVMFEGYAVPCGSDDQVLILVNGRCGELAAEGGKIAVITCSMFGKNAV